LAVCKRHEGSKQGGDRYDLDHFVLAHH
jgi:hypothetical protein